MGFNLRHGFLLLFQLQGKSGQIVEYHVQLLPAAKKIAGTWIYLEQEEEIDKEFVDLNVRLYLKSNFDYRNDGLRRGGSGEIGS